MKKIGLRICLVILFVCALSVVPLRTHVYNNETVAIVNEYEIYEKDVDRIYDQLDGDYNFNQILDDLIDEYVVVSYAQATGITVTDTNVDEVLKEYEENLPDLYLEGIRIYGEKDFRKGIQMQLIYDKIYSQIVYDELSANKEEWQKEFYNKMNLKGLILDGMTTEEFFEEYDLEFENYIFEQYIEKWKQESDIKIIEREDLT